MRKYLFILGVLLLFGVGFFISVKFHADTNTQVPAANISAENMSNTQEEANGLVQVAAPQDDEIPLARAYERITKKPFGIYITPTTSPVQPEKFSGYHTGTDFEILSGEENSDVVVHAICDGAARIKQRVSGYGGVFIQQCVINGEDVTVLYGHVALSSIAAHVGDVLAKGDTIGLLGAGNSYDTDGERKHLHLGVHKGTSINYRGYVTTESELSEWLDAETVLPFIGA